MTRDEAKKEFWKQNGVFEKGLHTNYEKVIKSYFIGSEFDKFIDKIFDEFENGSCETCEYHLDYKEESTGDVCGCNDTYCCKIGVNTPASFGCKYYKKKIK